jgi:hypothetical protein
MFSPNDKCNIGKTIYVRFILTQEILDVDGGFIIKNFEEGEVRIALLNMQSHRPWSLDEVTNSLSKT